MIEMSQNREIAEAFAQGARAGTGSHFFIEGDAIYSYGHHFPIAVIKDRSSKIAYFNKEGYSTTTSIHKGYVERALEAEGFKLELKSTEELQEMIRKD